MIVSQLIARLQSIMEEHGDMLVIQQRDQEGNGYDICRGAELGFADDDLEYCYSSVEEVVQDERELEEVTTVVVVFP